MGGLIVGSFVGGWKLEVGGLVVLAFLSGFRRALRLLVGGVLKVQIFLGLNTESHYFCIPQCPGGEIGRRTTLRWWRPKGCAGSNPVLGTKIKKNLSIA